MPAFGDAASVATIPTHNVFIIAVSPKINGDRVFTPLGGDYDSDESKIER
jgi:hypothetical protein